MKKMTCIAVLAPLTALALTNANAETFARPDVINWGASSHEIESSLEGQCANGFINRPIEPPFLPQVEDKQVQIDCDGLSFFGAPRWTEFVIGDDRLQMTWVMVEAEDRDRIVAAMTSALGDPSHVTEDYIAFTQGRAAWRHEPPEVLFYGEELDAWVNSFFDGE